MARLINLTGEPLLIGDGTAALLPPEPYPARLEAGLDTTGSVETYAGWTCLACGDEYGERPTPLDRERHCHDGREAAFAAVSRSVPVDATWTGDVSGVPDRAAGVCYVVSRAVAEACRGRGDLLYPLQTRERDGRTMVTRFGMAR